LLGYLVVFITKDMPELTEALRMLVHILAIQISPQIYFTQTGLLPHPNNEDFASYAEGPSKLQALIDSNQLPDSPLGVGLLRFLTPRQLDSQEEIASFHKHCAQRLLKHEPEAKLHWLLADTALVLCPGSNKVQSEITCMAFADDFRKSELASTKEQGSAEVFYSLAAWPAGDMSSAEFLARAWAELLNQIQKYIYSQINAKTEDG
ncbi:MAG: hypothetical protein JSW54_08830, partial [Fidelibacterota bacterium]